MTEMTNLEWTMKTVWMRNSIVCAILLTGLGCSSDKDSEVTPSTSTGDGDGDSPNGDGDGDTNNPGSAGTANGDGDGDGVPASDAGTNSPAERDSGVPERDSIYAMVSVVFSDDGRTTYLNTFDTLDITQVDLGASREYPGIPAFQAALGKLFEASDESATITRYAVLDTVRWRDEGRIGFTSFGLTSAARSQNFFVASDKAYTFFDIVDRVAWDPTALRIAPAQPDPSTLELQRDGLTRRLGEGRARDDLAFQAFYFSDDDFFVHGPTSQIAVYDPVSDEVVDTIEADCTGLYISAQDEAGNIYFSNGSSAVIPRLLSNSAPESCMVRIKAGEQTLDPDFQLEFADLTDGRQAASFLYVGEGKGLIQVFHDENTTIEPDSDPWALSASENWRLWLVDVETQTASLLDDVPYFGGALHISVIDGRTFLLLASADYASTTGYELLPDGTSVQRFVSPAWTYDLFKVR
jgi:hypothetical protein